MLPCLETDRLWVRMAGVAAAPERSLDMSRLVEDAEATLRYYAANLAFLQPWEPAKPEGFLTRDFWIERCRLSVAEYRAGQSTRLFIFPRERPGQVIGTVNFTNVVRGVFQACTLGYSLAEAEQGRGLMREALRASLDFAFGELRLHRVSANYMPRNERSARLLERLGFEVEGRAREYLMINGKWEDHVLTSIIAR